MKQKEHSGSYELTGSSECRNDDRGSSKAKMIRAETNTGTSVNSVVMQKSARSLHSTDRFEGILKETGGVKWDADSLFQNMETRENRSMVFSLWSRKNGSWKS